MFCIVVYLDMNVSAQTIWDSPVGSIHKVWGMLRVNVEAGQWVKEQLIMMNRMKPAQGDTIGKLDRVWRTKRTIEIHYGGDSMPEEDLCWTFWRIQ